MQAHRCVVRVAAFLAVALCGGRARRDDLGRRRRHRLLDERRQLERRQGFQFPPPNNGMANIVMPAMNGLVQTPVLDTPYSINSLTFNSGDGRFVMLGVEELTIGGGGVTNNDADIQSFFGSLRLSTSQTWNAAAGPLQFDLVNLNGFTLWIDGAHPVDMTSQISGGTGTLWLNDAYTSTVKLTGGVSNAFSNPIIVHGGTLLLQKTGGAIAVPRGVHIYEGGTVRLAGNEQISETNSLVGVSVGGLLDVNTRTETVDRLNIGGTVSVTGAGKLIAAWRAGQRSGAVEHGGQFLRRRRRQQRAAGQRGRPSHERGRLHRQSGRRHGRGQRLRPPHWHELDVEQLRRPVRRQCGKRHAQRP